MIGNPNNPRRRAYEQHLRNHEEARAAAWSAYDHRRMVAAERAQRAPERPMFEVVGMVYVDARNGEILAA